MAKQELSEARITDYKCPKCGTVTKITSKSMKPTASITCVDCGTRVFEESQTSLEVKIEALYSDRNTVESLLKTSEIDLSNLNIGNKCYRDVIINQNKLALELINLISDRIVILENIIKGN